MAAKAILYRLQLLQRPHSATAQHLAVLAGEGQPQKRQKLAGPVGSRTHSEVLEVDSGPADRKDHHPSHDCLENTSRQFLAEARAGAVANRASNGHNSRIGLVVPMSLPIDPSPQQSQEML